MTGVTLFKDDIEALARMLTVRFGKVEVATERWHYDSPEDFFAQSIEARPEGVCFKVGGILPTFEVALGDRAEVRASDADAAADAFEEVLRFLRERQGWVSRRYYGASWKSSLFAAALFALTLLRLGPSPAALLASAILWLMATFLLEIHATSERVKRSTLVLDTERKAASLWERHKSTVVAAFGPAVAILLWVLTYFFPAPRQ